MKTGFKNVMDAPEKAPKKGPFGPKAPEYDERSGRGIDAGCAYGIGHRNPVGSMVQSSKDVIPKGRVDTLKLYE